MVQRSQIELFKPNFSKELNNFHNFVNKLLLSISIYVRTLKKFDLKMKNILVGEHYKL